MLEIRYDVWRKVALWKICEIGWKPVIIFILRFRWTSSLTDFSEEVIFIIFYNGNFEWLNVLCFFCNFNVRNNLFYRNKNNCIHGNYLQEVGVMNHFLCDLYIRLRWYSSSEKCIHFSCFSKLIFFAGGVINNAKGWDYQKWYIFTTPQSFPLQSSFIIIITFLRVISTQYSFILFWSITAKRVHVSHIYFCTEDKHIFNTPHTRIHYDYCYLLCWAKKSWLCR